MLQPYQIFFPIGFLYAIWGALIWILFLLGLISYPGQIHAHVMIGGFLFSFALGFLMTAVPRFTGAPEASKRELGLATLLSLASFFGLYLDAIALCVLLFLATFFLSRYRSREYSPPRFFIFIPLGLLLGILGSLLMLLGNPLGRIFLFQGTMLAFILGVGGKLVSSLLGWSDLPLVQITTIRRKSSKFVEWLGVLGPLFLLFFGFALELAPWPMAARALRALSSTWIAVSAWKLYRFPRTKSRLANWLWVSCWGLVAGLWLYALVPTLGIHSLHLMFISGFGLMTIVIASRVTLAHGGYDLEIESKSNAIRWTGILILLAAFTRVAAPLTPAYMHHLGYAAGVWLLAMIVWSVSFIPKVFGR